MPLAPNIFQLAKAARTAEPERREENLLSGILGWCCSRAPNLLDNILRRSIRADQASWSEVISESPSSVEVETEEAFVLEGGVRRRIDLTFLSPGLLIGVENKVVPAEISIDQIEDYHRWVDETVEDDIEYAIVVMSPDKPEQASETLQGLTVGKDRTFHVSWQDIWRVANDLTESADPVESLAAQELKEAIELVPNLKPFSGFEAKAIDAMMNVPQVKGIEDFFRALRTMLESSPPGFVYGGYRRDRKSYDMPVSLWDEYHDPHFPVPRDTDPSEIYFGPWFQLVEGTFSIYLEARRRGRPILTSALQRMQTRGEDIRQQLLETFPEFTLHTNAAMPQVLASIDLTSPLLRGGQEGEMSELPQVSANLLVFLLDEIRSELIRK